MAPNSRSARIEAAGGVLWRDDDGPLRIAVVHRERYGDWSLPKGKRKPGELALATAIREAGEETGSQVAATRRLGRIRYQVDGVDKLVRYWAMRHVDGKFASSDEVDAMEWLEPAAAKKRLSYAGDRKMLTAFTAADRATSVLLFIRHAKAGKRSEWDGPDELRPLERTGRTQAQAIAEFGGLFEPIRIVSAQPLRCQQTVQPLAARLGLAVDVDPAFSDSQSDRDPDGSQAALERLVAGGHPVAVCSQGDTLQRLLGRPTAKAGMWVLGTRDAQIVSTDYYI